MTYIPGEVLAVLDLPVGSTICLDGQEVALRTADFVGFTSLPRDSTFHLFTARPAHRVRSASGSFGVTTGLVLFCREGFHCVRRYDPSTEELSSRPVDSLTVANLLSQIESQQVDTQRLVRYDQFITETTQKSWNILTSFMTETLLKRRGLESGAKIVPSTYEGDGGETLPQLDARVVDGVTVSYPSIPVIKAIPAVRHSRHNGTKGFLARLEGQTRSELFLSPHSADLTLKLVLELYYESNWKNLLADLQLSYILFIHLHCFASLSCWRDLIAMLSLPHVIDSRLELYFHFLEILVQQLSSANHDLFDDIYDSGEQEYGLRSSLEHLVSKLSVIQDPRFSALLPQLKRLTTSKLTVHGINEGDYIDHEVMDENGSDDDDGPTVVASEEVEASLQRIESSAARKEHVVAVAEDVKTSYPLLVAAMSPTEDIIMTCARVIDVASDVSLVREAADYLENVEARGMTSHGI